MSLPVTTLAEPLNIERLTVIVVMALDRHESNVAFLAPVGLFDLSLPDSVPELVSGLHALRIGLYPRSVLGSALLCVPVTLAKALFLSFLVSVVVRSV